MFRKFAGVAILSAVAFVPGVAQAATARTYGHLFVTAPHERTNTWYEAHRANVFQAANCRILQNLGNRQYLVQTNTPGGTCRYVIKETREERKTKEGRPMTIYRVNYVRNESGRLVNFELIIAMTGQSDTKTKIDMWMMADVAGLFVPVRAVVAVLEGSKSGVMEYISQNAR